MSAGLQPARRAPGVVSLCLSLCLLAAVAATVLGLPAAVRTPLAVPGLLLAPGYAWLSVARWRTGRPARTVSSLVLAVVLSLALAVLVGVAAGAVGAPVSPESVGIGLLLVTLPPACWVLLAPPAAAGAAVTIPPPGSWRRGAARLAPAVLAVGVFAAMLGWAASTQERPDSGPYTQLAYAGALAQLTGPVDVRPAQTVALPVQVRRSDGQPWSGLLTVSVEGQVQDTRAELVRAGDVVPLQVTAPAEPGLHRVTIDAVDTGTGEGIDLTLRLRVTAP